MRKKNPAAQSLAARRWAKTSVAERKAHMRMMRASAGSGRARSPERCYCGATSLHSARSRGFDCCKRAGVYPEQG